MTGEAARQWPWRLRLMDMNPLGSLLAVAVAGVPARAQYARTVRPALGWRSTWVHGELRPDERAWRVGVLNGGQHHAVVERVDYQCVPRGGEPGPWTDHAGLIAGLTVFAQRFVDEVDALRMRVRVTDAVGDSHERSMDLMRGTRVERGGLPD